MNSRLQQDARVAAQDAEAEQSGAITPRGRGKSKPRNATSWRNDEEALATARLTVQLHKMGRKTAVIGVVVLCTRHRSSSQRLYEKLKDGMPDLLEESCNSSRTGVKRKIDEGGVVEDTEHHLGSSKKLTDSTDSTLGFCSTDGDEEDGDNHGAIKTKKPSRWRCKIDTMDFQPPGRRVRHHHHLDGPNSAEQAFFDETHRLNVATTRAKSMRCVIGHKAALRGSKYWSELLTHAES